MSDTSLNRAMMKDRIFLKIAVALGQLGTCTRAQVGAVIIKDGRCITWGYNGAPPGLPHCNENNHGWDDTPHDIDHPPEVMALAGCRNATHAEANALAFAARQGISTDGGTLYVERSPCDLCSRLLIAAGVRRVVYAVAYRDESPIELLRSAGMEVERVE